RSSILGPGLSVHLARLRAPVPGGSRRWDRPAMSTTTACARVVLRHARDRADRPRRLQEPDGAPPEGVRLHRGLLQSTPAPLVDRQPLLGGVRAEAPLWRRGRPDRVDSGAGPVMNIAL